MPGRRTVGSDRTPSASRAARPRRRAAPDAREHMKEAVLSSSEHTQSFADLGVLPATVAALEAVGITHPFPIQSLTLPVALHGHDIIGQAKTGTGKTLGFGIPLLQRVIARGEDGYDDLADGKPQALVVVPTRELCVQVTSDLQKAASTRDVRVMAIYGGRAYEPQTEAL